jgi:class 3 adenylate cyclase/tetratricopeptide (TPR) repeat protein
MAACAACGKENPEEAAFCLRCGSQLPKDEPVERRKAATLLFCDMSGSTALGEHVDPEAVRALMFRYFHTMRDAIERHGGTVEKFIGDAVVAVFGIPVAREDDALRAVRAAAEMQARLGDLNVELERQFGTRIALRIGVNTGEVVAGDSSLRETMVTGDAVNVAARLEQAAAPDEVLLGAETYALVASSGVEVEPVPPLVLKGKSRAVPAFRLLKMPQAPRRELRKRTAMVGRSAEADLLARAFEEAVACRSARLATVVGEAGVGKSRLAQEVTSRVDGTVLRGRCLSYGEGITFWPIAEIVREAAYIRDEDSGAVAGERLRLLLEGEEDAEMLAGFVAQAVGLMDGTASQNELALGVRRFLSALARRRPLFLVIDDIQWGEPALLDLLSSVSSIKEAPILCLCLARPEFLELHPEWEATIRLGALGNDAAGELVAALLGGAVDAEVQGTVLHASQGNPLFVEELVAMLVAQGALTWQNGGWRGTHPIASLDVPPTLGALLAARLDQLGNEREALERGAVEGEVFHRGSVLFLSDSDDAVAPQLERLVAQDFIRPATAQFTNDAAFHFRHILIRDAAYNSVAKRVRAELHERFADWLEALAGDRLAEFEGILGYHLEQAYRYLGELGPIDASARAIAARAARHLFAAGRRAYHRSDVAAAASLLARASQMTVEPAARADAQIMLGDALAYAGRMEEAVRALEDAVQLATETGDRTLEWNARLTQAGVLILADPHASTPADLDRVAREAITILSALGDDRGLARAWRLLADALNAVGSNAESIAAARRAVDHARRADETRLEAEALILTMGIFGPTRPDEGIREARRVLAEKQGDLHVEAAMNAIIGLFLAMKGHFDEARAHCARTRALQEELGLQFYVASEGAFFSGAVEMLAGDPVAAEASIRRAYDIFASAGEQGTLSTVAALLAETLVEQGRDDEAEHYVVEAERLAAADDLVTQTLWRQIRARILARRTAFAEAEALALEAVRRAAGSDYLGFHGNACRDLGRVLAAATKPGEAERAFEEAILLYERKGDVVSVSRTKELIADLRSATEAHSVLGLSDG